MVIASRGDKLVYPIAGFSVAKIAVHSEFLKNMGPGGAYTLEELRFALSNAVLYVRYHGVSIMEHITSGAQFTLDRLCVQDTHDVDAAISYLRKSIIFAEKNKRDQRAISLNILVKITDSAADNSMRIKSLLTYSAANPLDRKTTIGSFLPPEVLSELVPIEQKILYQSECDARTNNTEKLAFLESKLPDLSVELLPYELTSKPSIRVRDFCAQLYAMRIDFDDQEQLTAVNRLINRAFELKIPAFERIYFAIDHNELYFLDAPYSIKPEILRPLGLFADLDKILKDFIQASNASKALSAAKQYQVLREQLALHCDVSLQISANRYLNAYIKEHKHPPCDTQRYFGSEVGYFIKWSTFGLIDKENSLPWSNHIMWAKNDSSHVIAHVLWDCGINLDNRLWEVFTSRELYDYGVSESGPLGKLPKKYSDYSCRNYIWDILRFISQKTALDSSMFDKAGCFEDKFISFYDKNWQLLVHPNELNNSDNAAVRLLLNAFTSIALTGTDEEKAVVKSFFFGRQDKRDLEGLIKGPNNAKFHLGSIMYNTPYLVFIMQQVFNNRTFTLFTFDEQIKIIFGGHICHSSIPLQAFIDMAGLSSKIDTLACVETMDVLLRNHEPQSKNWVMDSVFIEHAQVHCYSLKSTDLMRFLRLLKNAKFTKNTTCRILRLFNWDMPNSLKDIDHIDATDLAYIYRLFDNHQVFPSVEIQDRFSQLVLAKLQSVADKDARIMAAKILLSIDNQISIPLSDITLLNQTIDLLVADLCAKHGKDDNSQDYTKTLKTVITDYNHHLSQRDKPLFFSRLADSIQSQWALSEYMGIFLEPDKFLHINANDSMDFAIGNLAAVSIIFGEKEEDSLVFLEFISSPINKQQRDNFVDYMIKNKQLYKKAHALFNSSNFDLDMKITAQLMAQTMYAQFWNQTLANRAVIIDHLLVPANTVITDSEMRKASEKAFNYVSNKLFPNAKTDKEENFAHALLKAYLDSADKS